LKILVTGANGQLGRCLQDVLVPTKHQWVALDRLQLPISDAGQINSAIKDFRPDVVINAAAYTAVDKAEAEPEAAYEVNVRGPRLLAEKCLQVGARLLHVSTDYVFDGTAGVPYREELPTCPKGVYGRTKLEGERQVLSVSRHFVVLRTSWVFSEYGHNFLKTMLRLADREELGVVADQVGGPTYAGDIAEALVHIALSDKGEGVQGGVFHFCGEPSTSWHGFAEHIFDQALNLGVISSRPKLRAITTEEYPTPAKRPQYSVLSNEKVKSTFSLSSSDWQRAVTNVLISLRASCKTITD